MKLMKLTLIAILLAVTILPVAYPTPLLAGTYRVSASGSNTPPFDTWENASHTIQAAVDLCASSDTVLIAPGTYSPASGEQFPIHMGTDTSGVGVTIVGVNGASETALDAQGTGRVLWVYHSLLGLDGLTVRGGGVYLRSVSGVSIANCQIVNNPGDGIYSEFGCCISLVISNSSVSRNGGSGVYSESGVMVTGSSICDNGSYGVLANGVTVEDSEISGNGGRGVGSGPNGVRLVRTRLRSNGRGGAGYSDVPVINRNPEGSEYGDFVHLEQCIVSGNTGSGVEIGDIFGGTAIIGCTIADNTGNGYTGCCGYVHVSSSIIANNGGTAVAFGPECTLTCCDLFGNLGGDWVGRIADQNGVNGNFSSDPLFCGAASGDYRLSTSSACMNPCGVGNIGALGPGCGPTSAEYATWGRIKAMFR